MNKKTKKGLADAFATELTGIAAREAQRERPYTLFNETTGQAAAKEAIKLIEGEFGPETSVIISIANDNDMMVEGDSTPSHRIATVRCLLKLD
jgi:hypothetical protein